VIGFDNVPEAAQADLTSIAQPLREMGELAMRTLAALLHDEQVAEHVTLATQLVVRGSTAAPPA